MSRPSPSRLALACRLTSAVASVLVLVTSAGTVAAQTASASPPSPPLTQVVQLSARGFKEAPQDWLRMTLSTTRDGTDAATVQGQLRQALDAALALARQASQPHALEVRSGVFSLYPRYGSTGKINGWQGTTELVLEGRDFQRISSTAGRIQTLTVSGVGFSLSREAQLALESEVQAMAIERFKQRASEAARSFGFSTYNLREVAISAADQDGAPVQPRLMAMQASAPSMDGAMPVEAGKSTVNVTVSGSVQLR
jgi:predicted secreted protein